MPAMDMSDDVATMGDRMANARQALGLTQAEIAEQLGVKASTIKKWENDQSEPRSNRLYMLSGILNVNVMWLINGEGATPVMQVADHEIDPSAIKRMIAQLRKDVEQIQHSIDALEASL